MTTERKAEIAALLAVVPAVEREPAMFYAVGTQAALITAAPAIIRELLDEVARLERAMPVGELGDNATAGAGGRCQLCGVPYRDCACDPLTHPVPPGDRT